MANPFERMGRLQSPGSSVTPGYGYHNLPWDEYRDAPVHRGGTVERVAHMVARMETRGRRGLDIGCSVGGVTFGLQMAGASMIGMDADRAAIRCAREVEARQRTGAHFLSLGIPSLDWTKFSALFEFDFIVFLSAFMWVAKEDPHGTNLLMRTLSTMAPVLWFETAQGPQDGSAGTATPFQSAADVEQYLRRFYPSVENTGVPVSGWFNRSVFLCKT